MAGLLIALPNASLGGVTVWAERITESLGRDLGSTIASPDPKVDIEAAVSYYVAGARDMFQRGLDHVVLSPHLSGSCYAAACVAAHRLDRMQPNQIGMVGWMHTDIRHDIELLRRFAPALDAVICVSGASSQALTDAIAPDRRVVAHTPVSAGLSPRRGSREPGPLRLVYTGRLERFQKRTLALPWIVQALRRRGIDTELTVIGDGPARDELSALAARIGGIILHPPVEPSELLPHLTHADLYVLPSRSEGLGLGRLEASLAGCAPVVCGGSGGATEGITHGIEGLITSTNAEANEETTGLAMGNSIADAIEDSGLPGLSAMGLRARANVIDMCDPRKFRSQLQPILARQRTTSSQREFWASVSVNPLDVASFTIPYDAPRRAAKRVRSLGLPSVILYGAGAHTDAIWDAIESLGIRIAGVIDDDPARAGDDIRGAPVVASRDAQTLNANDVLISSWLHEDAIWAQRDALESQGLRVHRIYAALPSLEPCLKAG